MGLPPESGARVLSLVTLRRVRSTAIWVALLLVVAITVVAVLLESGFLTPWLVRLVNDQIEPQGLHFETEDLTWRPWSGLMLDGVRLTRVEPQARTSHVPGIAAAHAADDPPADGTAATAESGSAEPGSAESRPAAADSSEFGDLVFPDAGGPAPSLTSGDVESRGGAGRAARLTDHLVYVEHVEVLYRFVELIFGRPRINRVKVVRPDIDLVRLDAWSAARPASERDSGGGGGGVPELVIEDLRLLEGHVSFGDDWNVSGLRLVGSFDGDGDDLRLRVDDAGLRLSTDRLSEEITMTGNFDVIDGLLELNGLHLEAAGGRVSFQGHLDLLRERDSSLLATGFAIPLRRVGDWVGADHPLLSGDLEFTCVATGPLRELRLSGEAATVGDDAVAREMHFSGRRQGDGLGVEAFHLRAGDSRVDLSGNVALADSIRADGVAIFRNVNPAVALAEPDLAIVSGVSGAVRFDGVGHSFEDFVGTADLQLTSMTIADLELDEGIARARFDSGALDLEAARFARGESFITGSGSISEDRRVDADFRGSLKDLADLGGVHESLTRLDLQGEANAEMRLRGRLAAPEVTASLRFEQTHVFGVLAEELELAFRCPALGEAPASIEVIGDGLGYGDNALARGTATGEVSEGSIRVQRLFLQSRERGELELAGELDLLGSGQLVGRVQQLEIRSPDRSVEWKNEGPLRIERSGQSLTFSGLNLADGRGRIEGDVLLHDSGEAFVRASGSGVDLSVFSPFLLLEKPVGGVLEFQADAVVGADTLMADATFDLVGGRWGDDALDRVGGGLEVRDTYARFDEIAFVSDFATATLDGRVDLPGGSFRRVIADSAARASILDRMVFGDLQAHLETDDFTWFWDLSDHLPPFGGSGSMTVRADGPLLRPQAEVQAQLQDGVLDARPLDWFSAKATYDGEILRITEGVLESGSGRLRTRGDIPLEWSFSQAVPAFREELPWNLELDGESFPLNGISPLVQWFELFEGVGDSDLALVGDVESLRLDGTFEAREVRVALPIFADPLVGGTVKGYFDESGVTFESARVHDVKGGVMESTGRIEMDGFRPTGYDLDVEVKSGYYRGPINGIEATGSGDLRVSTAILRDGAVVPHFTGEIRVERADMDERALTPVDTRGLADMPAGVNAPDEQLGPVEQPLPTLATAAIRIRASNSLWLRTSEIEGEGAADITLFVTEDFVGIEGTARSLRGNYRVANSRFEVNKAEMTFVDAADPTASFLDAEAETRVLDETVSVTVTGPFLEPTIELTSDSNMSEEEIYELLALRIKRDDGFVQEPGLVGNALQRSYLNALGSRFGRELSREFVDTFEVQEGDPGYDTSVSVGKSVGRDLYVRYKQNLEKTETGDGDEESNVLLESPEQALILEYYLNRIFTLQGEAGTIQGDEYLNFDLRAEWGY